MPTILKDIGSMVFGLLAFHLCRYLLWLAPRTVVVANAHMQISEGVLIKVDAKSASSRILLVRCHLERKE